jgi:rhodanese-related sulfurtransferase
MRKYTHKFFGVVIMLCIANFLIITYQQWQVVVPNIKSNIVVSNISAATLLEISSISNNLVIIDVRSPWEFSLGHIPGAINIPFKRIMANTSTLEAFNGKEVVLYCHSGVRVRAVIEQFRSSIIKGLSQPSQFYQLYQLKGDYRAWRGNGHTIAI